MAPGRTLLLRVGLERPLHDLLEQLVVASPAIYDMICY